MKKIWVKEIRGFVNEDKYLSDFATKKAAPVRFDDKSLKELNEIAETLGLTKSRTKVQAINKIQNA
jgi:hypothetical protein